MSRDTIMQNANAKGDNESTVQIAHIADDDVEAISALAGLIWREHYANIISAAQIEFMLQQRYDPAVIREQLAHPRNQRSGFGGLLIARALGAARKEGCKALVLAVNKANAKAISAYTKYGFRIREAIVQDIGGGFVMDDYVMVKDV